MPPMTTPYRLEPFRRRHQSDRFGYSSRVVFLERTADPASFSADQAAPWFPGIDDYLDAYHRVGAPWLWSDRLAMGRDRIERDLMDPRQRCWRIDDGHRLAGFCEVITRSPAEAEILHCGLIPAARGRGLGQRLINSALAGAHTMGAQRVWLHTCSEDSDAALGFYQGAGFRIFATRLEWVIDPRRRGLLDADAGNAVDLPWTGQQAVSAFNAAANADSDAAQATGNHSG